MSMTAMKAVSGMMAALELPYAFMRWSGETIPEIYFVGEYSEIPSATREENGRQDVSVILRGFTRGDYMHLEEAKERIKGACPRRMILENGAGLAVFYDQAMSVPTGDAQIKSIKINLICQEWRVN